MSQTCAERVIQNQRRRKWRLQLLPPGMMARTTSRATISGITAQGGKNIEVDKDEVWLCRCGHSQNKPFCDGSHKKYEFKSNLDEQPQEGETP